MFKNLRNLLLIFSFSVFPILFLLKANLVHSASNHIVISEVQISGTSSSDDFVELYNPTDTAIDLTNYRLVKRTSSGTTDTNIASFQSGDIIPAYGYFLWCNSGVSELLSCDRSTSQTVSNNNSVGLRDGELDTGILVDSVTFGSPSYPLGEGTFIDLGSVQVPGQNESVERKACPYSTFSSMNNGDSIKGNGEDSDNNSSDFVNKTSPEPQNSLSSTEIPSCGAEPALTPTLQPSPTFEPTPTEKPLPTETPLITPTETPIVEPTPSLQPSPTLEPTPTDEPNPTPTPSQEGKIIGRFIFPGYISTCRLSLEVQRIGFFFYAIPKITCD